MTKWPVLLTEKKNLWEDILVDKKSFTGVFIIHVILFVTKNIAFKCTHHSSGFVNNSSWTILLSILAFRWWDLCMVYFFVSERYLLTLYYSLSFVLYSLQHESPYSACTLHQENPYALCCMSSASRKTICIMQHALFVGIVSFFNLEALHYILACKDILLS